MLSASTSFSEESVSSSKWYQIELLVFANSNEAEDQGEHWPTELRLRYPTNTVVLKPPVDSSLINRTIVDESDLLEAQAIGTPTIYRDYPSFTQLPEDALSLRDAANNILSQYQYRPLFHGAWQQPIEPRETATAIAIYGGEKFDNHYELEGHVLIAVERYLHIHTDLWLNRFIQAIGSDAFILQKLPTLPRQKTETLADVTSLVLSDDNSLTNNLAQPLYQVERTVVMRQHRRMRSEELHYIDHPLFGLVVRVTPIEINDSAATPGRDTQPQSDSN